MLLYTPDDIPLQNHLQEVDVHAAPADWQLEISRSTDSAVLWWDVCDEGFTIHVGQVGNKPPEDPGHFDARALRSPRDLVPTVCLIGALDFGPELEWLLRFDGAFLDDEATLLASTVKADRAWIIPTREPLSTQFSPERWRQLKEASRKATPKDAGLSPSSKPAPA